MNRWIKSTAVAVATGSVVLLIKLAIDPIVEQDNAPFVLFGAGVMVAAWYGGTFSGLLCTLLATAISHHFFNQPRYSFHFTDAEQLLAQIQLLVEGVIISVLSGKLRFARDRAKQSAEQTEYALRESEAAALRAEDAHQIRKAIEDRFHQFVDANLVGFFVGDDQGRILDANDAFLDLVGCTRDEMKSGECNWREMTAPECRDVDDQALAQVAASGKCDPYEKEYVHSNGGRVSTLVGVAALAERGHFAFFSADFTQQKLAAYEQEQARHAAEMANRAKTEFLANISHELRTPMNAILGMTELVLEEPLSDATRDYLLTVKDSADTLLYLLNDLLDFSRIDAGNFELDVEAFGVREMLDETVKSLSLRGHEKGLELACYIHSKVPNWLMGDSRRIRQILINLVGNAIKFTEQGEVTVSAVVHEQNEDLCEVEFVVSDTGIGISRENQERIFAPFTQADASTTRRYSGSGLGLSISRQLVAKMQGRLWVDSEEGLGSRFHFRLPLTIPDRPTSASESPDFDEKLTNMRVLVVDDNATNRRILDEMLRNWQFHPVLAADGARALAVLDDAKREDSAFPLILVDGLMPSMDGFMFIEEARKRGLTNASTILMLSSADRRVFADRCDEVPVDRILEKPVSQSDLFDAIATTLSDDADEKQTRTAIIRVDRPLRILVAEDTPANQKVVQAILERRGHQVEIAHNGRDAVEMLKQDEFDVVLMDIQMPTMDGYQATAAIRDLSESDSAELPVIAMTAHAMEGDRERCLNAGMDAYISKPLNAANLLRLVESTRHSETLTMTNEPGAEKDSIADTVSNDDDTRRSEIDLDAALERLGGDRQMLQELIGYYFEDIGTLLDGLEAAIELRNLDDIKQMAHSVKGLVSNFDSRDATAIATRIEHRSESDRLDEQRYQLGRLRRATAELNRALRKYKDHVAVDDRTDT